MSWREHKRLISVSEYYKMAEIGILMPEEKLELIHGEILIKMPSSPYHAGHLMKLNTLLGEKIDDQVILSVKQPLRLNEYNEPEPDIALLKFKEDYYASAHPGPLDVLFILEVSHASLNFDKEIKGPLYALFGIQTYIILDLESKQIELYTDPKENKYLKKNVFQKGGVFEIPGFDLEIPVSEILS